jgi:hypothetical protein
LEGFHDVSDDTIKDDKTRGEASQAGYANSEVRRNPDQPTTGTGRGEGAEEITISPDAGDTPEDLLDRIDDEDPVTRDQTGSPIDSRRS